MRASVLPIVLWLYVVYTVPEISESRNLPPCPVMLSTTLESFDQASHLKVSYPRLELPRLLVLVLLTLAHVPCAEIVWSVLVPANMALSFGLHHALQFSMSSKFHNEVEGPTSTIVWFSYSLVLFSCSLVRLEVCPLRTQMWSSKHPFQPLFSVIRKNWYHMTSTLLLLLWVLMFWIFSIGKVLVTASLVKLNPCFQLQKVQILPGQPSDTCTLRQICSKIKTVKVRPRHRIWARTLAYHL